MTKRLQEIIDKYTEDPEKAEELVKNHEWTKKDIKTVKKAKKYGWFALPKEAREMIDSILAAAEDPPKKK
jgi:hypothetical protein